MALIQKSKILSNEVESNAMNFSLSKDVKTYWERLKDAILNVGINISMYAC